MLPTERHLLLSPTRFEGEACEEQSNSIGRIWKTRAIKAWHSDLGDMNLFLWFRLIFQFEVSSFGIIMYESVCHYEFQSVLSLNSTSFLPITEFIICDKVDAVAKLKLKLMSTGLAKGSTG